MYMPDSSEQPADSQGKEAVSSSYFAKGHLQIACQTSIYKLAGEI